MAVSHSEMLQEIEASPEGPEIGALFDFDGTIIAGFSATMVLMEKIRRRELSMEQVIDTVSTTANYSTGGIGFSGLMMGAAKLMKGQTEESFYDFGEELYEKHIARKIYPETRALIEAHIAKGHTVAIVSSAAIYQIEPTARDLGIEHVLCSRYEVKNGEFTGDVMRPLCFGEGKVIASEKLAKITDMNLDKSYFYTDSDDDIELLERVGKPRPINPNFRLETIARDNGWPMVTYSSRGKAGWLDYVRTLSASGAMLGGYLAGLPIWAMTGSRREGTNFAAQIFGDVGAALAGVTLEITGEENLWKSRPCIFIFNHQSKADLMVLAKLIRKDFGGIAKQEMRDIPVYGAVLEFMGTVFIDRANARSAIDSMQPLIDAVHSEGKSIIIAPEGTRTLTPKLAPFKKGPFHMALQTGVPLVPIVIHNTHDVSPKGEFLVRPANVRIDVLEPIDVSDWDVKNLNEHIRDVRKLFLDALGQTEDEEEVVVTAVTPRKDGPDDQQANADATKKAKVAKPRAAATKAKPAGKAKTGAGRKKTKATAASES